MLDFILAALPWVAIAVAVAITVARFHRKKNPQSRLGKTAEESLPHENAKPEKEEENYLSYGISFGLCFGVAIGTSLMQPFGTVALTYGICFGLLFGVITGSCIKKK